jgi:hypothetical protein
MEDPPAVPEELRTEADLVEQAVPEGKDLTESSPLNSHKKSLIFDALLVLSQEDDVSVLVSSLSLETKREKSVLV